MSGSITVIVIVDPTEPEPKGEESILVEEVRGPSAKQIELAERILERMKGSLVKSELLGKCSKDNVFSKFYDVQFLVLVPRFSTLQHQTADRVEKEGLLYTGEAALDKVQARSRILRD